ncbi:MAG TPA: hypothetical protein VHA10_08350 [Hypericibacter adhaerens]|jgi:hypothetical protein|uniref:Uncharacterized protein n=1 Tax=Hypericibacter adhaerens TaxID=2602016 RepID=A0A5J6MUA9_9PROT|nr:hypothetical protein [Hypericibacter adhaerens]QEX20757.1 hypothetical protein FRZ61_06760 [Hypericibacter adhaerens]HWA43208.1 hypothetical protein [Hypericibacter adhaerens]
METSLNWIIGGVIALLGILGLFLASGASDTGIYLFGLLLFLFAVLFAFGLIRRGIPNSH